MSEERWDVVVVGAGVAGALTAKHLTNAGLRVLMLEAGPATAETISGYDEHVRHFYGATSKGAESPWPPNANAPQPDTGNLQYNNGYFDSDLPTGEIDQRMARWMPEVGLGLAYRSVEQIMPRQPQSQKLRAAG